MLRQDGIPPISRNKPRRGSMRGAIGSDDESRPRGRDKRSVHFEEQQAKTSAPARGGTRGGRGLPAPRGTAAAGRPSSAVKEPAKRGGFTQQIANHIQGQPGGRRNNPPTGDHAAYQEKFNQLKKSRERERTAAIANGTFADPNKRVTLAEAITPVGTCRDMCPEFERVRRTVQRDVWPEERDESKPDAGPMNRIPDESRMVKKFTRSAAGQEEQLPSDLRPPEVLNQTIDYLYDTLISNAPRLADVHHFVWDRTRAIRNDFSIQQVSKNDDVRIAMDTYERIARFHILSMHILAEKENQYTEYNAQQEREQLDKTILSLVDYYEDNKDRVQSPNEAEFRAYQILFQIQSPKPNLEDRLQDWSKRVQQDPRVHTALRIYTAACSIANPQGPLKPYTSHKIAQSHWGSFWNLVSSPEVSYLMGCVSEIYFPMIRRKALHSLWQAYRPRGGRAPSSEWTLDELRPVLGMQTEDEVADYCEQCGFTIKEHADGSATLDLGSVIGGPSDIGNSQVFTKLVDDKREGRSLSAVMNGMNVRQARAAGLLQGTDHRKGIEDKTQQVQKKNTDEDSLFVPDNSNASQQGSTNQPSPWASSSQSASTSNTTPFSHLKSTSTPPNQTWSPETGIKFGSSSTKSPFAASNNTVNQTKPPHIPAQPVFAPSSSSTTNLFGVPTSFGLPKQDNASSPALGNAPKLLFDRTPGSGSTATAQASSTPPSQPSLLQSSITPSAASGSSNPFGSTSSFSAPSNTTPNAPSLFSAQPTPNVAEQHLGSASQATRQPTGPPLFTNTNQETSSSTPPQSNSEQQPPSSSLFTNVSNQKAPSASQASPQPVSTSSASNQEAFAKQAAEQRAKAEERKQAAEAEQRRRDAAQREAEEQEQRAKELAAHVAAQRRAQREKTLDDLTRGLLLGPNGFLSQYIEYNVGPLIEATQNQVQQERLIKEANELRVGHIMGRYGRKWRDICWKRRLARQGRERRQRQQRDAEARRRREQNTNISAEMEAFRHSADSSHASPATSTHRRLSDQRRQSQTDPTIGGRASSASHEPDLASNSASANRRSSHTNDGTSATRSSADHNLSDTHRSHRSVFATSRQPEIRAQRKDTTRSDYFRLKVMGIQPPPDSLPPAKPASGYRATGLKRLRESDSYIDLHRSEGSSVTSRDLNASTTQSSMPPPSKRPASQVEVENNMKSSTSTASSLDQQDEDDALLEQVRQAQQAMRESIDFFRGEMDEMKRDSTRTSRSNSVDHQSRALARVGLESVSQSRDRTRSDADKVSTHFDAARSSRAAAPPPKYRSRVSKFLPREEYADMRMLRDGHYGASPRPSSKLSPNVRPPRGSHESAQLSTDTVTKPPSPSRDDKTQPQSKTRTPSPLPPRANGTHDAPPASLASSQSHHPSETFPPGATLNTLISNSTKPSTSSSAFAAVPASTSFGFASRLTPNGDSSNQNKITHASASTPFISESSAFQPAASSSFSIRPETPQFAPQSSSPFTTPKNPTLGASAQNGAKSQTQQTLQPQETIAYPTLPSSSPDPETGTQRHERLLSTAGKATRNATSISPPRLSKRRSREVDGDDDTMAAAGKAQGQSGGAFVAQNTATAKRQKTEKRTSTPSTNAFALLADGVEDDEDDGSRDLDSSGEDGHDDEKDDATARVKGSVATPPTNGLKNPNPEAVGSDTPSLLHPGQGIDVGTSSLDGNSQGGSGESEDDEGSDDDEGSVVYETIPEPRGFRFDVFRQGRMLSRYPDDEEEEVEDEDEIDDDDDSSSAASGSDEEEEDDDDDAAAAARRDADVNVPASKPARDFGGKTGASVEDAIEL